MKNISLTEKLILNFLILGIGAIFIISVFSFFSTKRALMNRTFDQLTSLRIVKRNQIELFFKDRLKDLTLLAVSEDTKNIARTLNNPHGDLSIHPDADTARLKESFSAYLEKYKLLKNYFSIIRISGSGQFLISGDLRAKTIQVPDHSSFRNEYPLFEEKMKEQKVVLEDLLMSKITRQPVLVMGALIPGRMAGDADEGFIVLEIPVEAINTIMLNNNPESGLGGSGETYLVGQDYKMRSNSRFIPNSVLKTKVITQSVIRGFKGQEGSLITPDYRNIPVLSSFSKTIIPGLKWVILAEIDLQEAMIPIYKMRNSIVFLSIFISLIFFCFVFLISRAITRPIIHLRDAAIKVGKGNYDIHLPIETSDEIGSLTEAFNTMTIQIQEKTKELRHEKIGRIRSVIDGEEIERQRLSRELHDGIGQSLVALKLRLESLLYIDEKKIKENIIVLKDQIDGTIDEIRRISNNLMPSVLEVFGITIALKNLCSETGEHAGIKIDFECRGDLDTMHTKLKTYIYRIAQEALNNIVKHSGASILALRIIREENQITLHIKDNGKGFVLEEAALERGNGLYNMRERVNLLHGTFEIKSFINKGTDIIVQLPVF